MCLSETVFPNVYGHGTPKNGVPFFCFGGVYRLSDLFMVLIGSSWKTKRVCLVSEGSDMFCIVPVNSPDSLSWFLSRLMVPPML